MPKFVVEFRGLLLDPHVARLGEAQITFQGSRMAVPETGITSGASVHTAIVEAGSAQDAVSMVADALGAHAAKFTGWQAEPI